MQVFLRFVCLAALIGAAMAEGKPSDTPSLPYDSDPEHAWNRLHRTLFVRKAADGRERVHATDPFLYENGTFLLEGDSHKQALARLDQFLAEPADRSIDDALKRLALQRDLWAAFDYAAWVPGRLGTSFEARTGRRRPAYAAGQSHRQARSQRRRDRRAAGQLRAGREVEEIRGGP
jgi:hypothetical protein